MGRASFHRNIFAAPFNLHNLNLERLGRLLNNVVNNTLLCLASIPFLIHTTMTVPAQYMYTSTFDSLPCHPPSPTSRREARREFSLVLHPRLEKASVRSTLTRRSGVCLPCSQPTNISLINYSNIAALLSTSPPMSPSSIACHRITVPLSFHHRTPLDRTTVEHPVVLSRYYAL